MTLPGIQSQGGQWIWIQEPNHHLNLSELFFISTKVKILNHLSDGKWNPSTWLHMKALPVPALEACSQKRGYWHIKALNALHVGPLHKIGDIFWDMLYLFKPSVWRGKSVRPIYYSFLFQDVRVKFTKRNKTLHLCFWVQLKRVQFAVKSPLQIKQM